MFRNEGRYNWSIRRRGMGSKHQSYLRLFIVIVLTVFSLPGCQSKDGGQSSSTSPSGSGNNPGQIDGAVLEIGPLSSASLPVKDSGKNNCLTFDLTLKGADGEPLSAQTITLKVATDGEIEDPGALENNEVSTDDNGKASGQYCSGNDVLSAVITASYGSVKTNSARFEVASTVSFELVYVGSSFDALGPNPDDEAGGVDKQLEMHLFSSGPKDCVELTFRAQNGTKPVSGLKVSFSTQAAYPRGTKLAYRSDSGTVSVDLVTQQKIATYEGETNANGFLVLPVCAGNVLGIVRVKGSYKDPFGESREAYAPVLSIAGGIPNFTNFTLAFDNENARSLRGYFNDDSPHVVETKVLLGSRLDGKPITSFPVSVNAETGLLRLPSGGIIDEKTSMTSFTLSAQHMVNYYAHPVHSFNGYPDALTRCDPDSIEDSISTGNFSYRDLSLNWRSTVVYSTRGQEAFYDYNGNGVYDQGGDGFWDKNQNGVFDDGIDLLTHDANNNGEFDSNSEWFIDLPSPFVDVNENLAYDEGVDALIGDTYQAPNGKRDADTLIWKSEVYPIYMGSSPFAFSKNALPNNIDLSGYSADIVDASLITEELDYDDDVFWPSWSDAEDRKGFGRKSSYFFAHGICGNLLPGGTKISVQIEPLSEASFGARSINNFIKIQPGDQKLEHARRLLKDEGGASATINFNAIDHPSKHYGYPILFETEIGPCTNECTGAVANVNAPGLACDDASMYLKLNIEEPEFAGGGVTPIYRRIQYSSIMTCNCASGAYPLQGVCTCPDGTGYNGATSSCEPI